MITLAAMRSHPVAFAARQRGVAAIEFALVFSILFVVMYGIATFGAVLYIQQVVSRAAEDGARAIPLLPASPTFSTPQKDLIKGVVWDSVAAALVVPNSEAGNPRPWIVNQVKVTPEITGSGNSRIGVVTVTYSYGANRLLPSILLFDISRWMPDKLTGRATVAL